MNANIKKTLLSALSCLSSDDLERAERAFTGFSEAELDMQFGASGKTRREILQSYRDHRKPVTEARDWLNAQ